MSNVRLDLGESGGVPRRLRFTYGAIEEAEDLCGASMNSLIEDIRANTLSYRHVRMMLFAGLKGGGTKRDGETLTPDLLRQKIEDYLDAGGYMQTLVDSLLAALQESKVLARPPEEAETETETETEPETTQPDPEPETTTSPRTGRKSSGTRRRARGATSD